MEKSVETVDSVAVRFAGDSGDGMQVTGSQFTATTALAGNDLATFPDFPAEIRAPAGSLAGVSGFQINFSSQPVFTAGDAVDVLIVMNPAALQVNLKDLKEGGVLIANAEAFSKKNLERAGFEDNPLETNVLGAYRVFKVDITGMTLKAVEDLRLSNRSAVRCKNFFSLGLVYWLFGRDPEHTIQWIKRKFKDEKVADANLRALNAGYSFGETSEMFAHSYQVKSADIKPGKYRNISGNEALALGLVAASQLSGLKLFLGSYPITPASDILHYLSNQKPLGVRTFQAEDEIGAVCAAIGAAYAGCLAVTTTSGPGMALKAEAMGLAATMELPLVVVDVQRAGPSTGMPTKAEQSDLLQSLYGRNGECPIPVIAASSPGDCFYAAIEAATIAVRHMVPVVLLSDGVLANGAEPWPVPELEALPAIDVNFRTEAEGFQPYLRDENLARPWAIPGTPGLEHRLGGIEKQAITGNISYDPDNHQLMTETRAEKVARVADHLPPLEVTGDAEGDLLVVGWGSTAGALESGVKTVHARGYKVGHVQLRHLNPLPKDLEGILRRYKRVVVAEMNMGQLAKILRERFLIDVDSLCKMKGQPFKESEIVSALLARLESN